MNQPLRMSSAASLVLLGSMIAGCAAQHAHVAAASRLDGKPVELGFATRALAALNTNNISLAIDFAEKAVAKNPGDAPLRTMLGNAYFAAGRFVSAEAAYRDSLTIDSNQPKVILKLALVEIAQGKDNRAVAMLNDTHALLDPSDYGLALALAGRSDEAIAILDPVARQPGADATVRQNLALAHALAGHWDEARVIAGQDVPANQLDGRIQQWMQLAKPAHAADQVAAVVGVSPALLDPGQPAQLSLNQDPQPRRLARPTVKFAAIAPAPEVVPARIQERVTVQAAKPAFAAVPQASAVPVAIAAVAPAPEVTHSGLATFAFSAVTEAKAVLAAMMPHHRPAAPTRPKMRVAATGHATENRGKSHAVVQLGAYASSERVLAAWNGDSRKYASLRAYAPMSARFASAKGTFYRLSVQGFHSIAEAKALCGSLRHSGGACFVRNVQGDAPVTIALR